MFYGLSLLWAVFCNVQNLHTYNHYLVDIECALRDFLEEQNYHRVQYKDVADTGIAIGVTHYNTWIFMLRKYMHKYHPDIKLKWCEHSLYPHEYCECEIDQCDHIQVNILKMICDHHSYRTWWTMKKDYIFAWELRCDEQQNIIYVITGHTLRRPPFKWNIEYVTTILTCLNTFF